MKVDIFDFELPRELIASQPVSPRDASRLLDLTEAGTINDRHFFDLPDLLNEGDVLVFNDTKVIPARLYGARGEALVEVTLYHPVDGIQWWSFIKNSKRLKSGDIIRFYTDTISPEQSLFTAIVIEKKDDDGVLISFNCNPAELGKLLEQYGFMPLPPYIKRERPSAAPQFLAKRIFNETDEAASTERSPQRTSCVREDTSTGEAPQIAAKNSFWFKFSDRENYQTVYAKHEGAVAAPTAGLHFTPEVLQKLRDKGVQEVFLTLHVGAGTFLPVKTDTTEDHKMHAEYGVITPDAVEIINAAKRAGKRVIAVGTTSLRLLETAGDNQGVLHPYADETNIFITPGYKFKIIDMLITNFHLPKSTLFMLVSAVAGLEIMQNAYHHAIEEKYRFYSYGDSSILKCVNKI